MKKLISVFAVALVFVAFAAYATKTTYVKVAVVDDSEPDRTLLKNVALVDLLASALATIQFNPTTSLIVDAAGGADEVTVAAASTTFVGAVRITQAAAPPVACAAGTEGTLYVDADTHLLCVCNATDYVTVADGSTACS